MKTAHAIRSLQKKHEWQHKNIIDRYGYIIIQIVAIIGLISSLLGLVEMRFNLGSIFGIIFIFSIVLFITATYWQQQEHHL